MTRTILQSTETADARARYEAVRGGRSAGVIDLSDRGRIEVAGSEAVTFLNGMVTNDIAKLEAGAWMPLAFPNVQGRLVALARVLRTEAQTFLFDTEATTHPAVLKLLQRFTLAGDFRVTDRTEDLACLTIQGAGAERIIRETFGDEAASLARGRVLTINSIHLIRATHTGEDGFDLFPPAADSGATSARLIDAGAQRIGADALDVLRIEAGIPRHGTDVTDQNVVLEAHQPDAVSFTKGCYVGQEIIARIHWRGHVAKRLAGVEFDDDREVAVNSALVDAEDKPAGTITSSIFSPARERTVALALVRYAHLAPGTILKLADDPPRTARVVELPFVRGSWHTTTQPQLDSPEPTR